MQKNKISSGVNYDNFLKSDLKGFKCDNPSVALKLEENPRGGGGYSGFQVTGMIEGIFWV